MPHILCNQWSCYSIVLDLNIAIINLALLINFLLNFNCVISGGGGSDRQNMCGICVLSLRTI